MWSEDYLSVSLSKLEGQAAQVFMETLGSLHTLVSHLQITHYFDTFWWSVFLLFLFSVILGHFPTESLSLNEISTKVSPLTKLSKFLFITRCQTISGHNQDNLDHRDTTPGSSLDVHWDKADTDSISVTYPMNIKIHLKILKWTFRDPFVIYVYVCVPSGIYVHPMPLELELQAVMNCLVWTFGTKPGVLHKSSKNS